MGIEDSIPSPFIARLMAIKAIPAINELNEAYGNRISSYFVSYSEDVITVFANEEVDCATIRGYRIEILPIAELDSRRKSLLGKGAFMTCGMASNYVDEGYDA
jgi:hypothetical protein